MNTTSVTTDDIRSWIDKVLESDSLVKYEIDIEGKSEKGEGHLGEIVFVNVDGTTKENEKKSINFVIKHAKSNELFRKGAPVKQTYETEAHIYDQVFPAFKKFQLENNIRDIFNPVPKCYKTLIMDNMEAIVLENLKKSGYELRDKMKPLNSHHLKAVLIEYGKLHALSFAVRDQNMEQFNLLANYRSDVLKEFLDNDGFRNLLQTTSNDVQTLLQENNDTDLLRKLGNLLVKDTLDIVLDLLTEEEPQSVIIHGDSWNNNFMYKYPDTDRTTPSKVAILDWQLSHIRSPATDLSYFLYANSSKEDLDKFDDLMETYYSSFSHFLKELGSNPEELFSYSDLKRHWKKYSLFGLLFVPMIFRMVLVNKEDAPALENLQEGEDVGSKMDAGIQYRDLYYGRVKAIVEHYFEYNF